MTTGVLRITLAVDPPVPTAGTRVVFLVRLVNRGAAPALDVTLDVVPPADAIVDLIEPDLGVGYRDGRVVRWVLPGLAAGGEGRLRLEGVLSRTSRPDGALCAVLLSAGAPVEHCVPVEAVASDGRPGSPASEPLTTLPTAEPAGALPASVDRAGALRWGLLVLGLAALGTWLGLRRGPDRSDASQDEED
jgi:hypothetical protein